MLQAMTESDVASVRDDAEKRAEDAFRKKHGRAPSASDEGPWSDQELADMEEMADLSAGVLTEEEREALNATLTALRRELEDLEASLESDEAQDNGPAREDTQEKRETLADRIAQIEAVLEAYG